MREKSGDGSGPAEPEFHGVRPATAPVRLMVTDAPDRCLLEQWDALVGRTPGTDVTQLSSWARVRATVGFSAMHVLAFDGDEVVGGAQLLCRRLPVVGRVGYLPYGPVIDPAAEGRAEVCGAIADSLRWLVGDYLHVLFVQPPEGADDVSAELRRRGFRPSSAGIAPTGSVRIDLCDDLATIRSRFGRRLRSWPPRWEERGVKVSVGDEGDLPLLSQLMTHSAHRHGFVAPTPTYLYTLYRELAARGNAAVFVGCANGRPVAADLVTVCGDMIRGRLGGFDRGEDAARLSVPAAIRWEIIKWGQDRGLRWLDFGGLSVATLDALLGGGDAGATVSSCDQPKLTFGGTAFRYPPAVEMVVPAPLRVAYDLARTSPGGRAALHRARVALRRGPRRRCRGAAAPPPATGTDTTEATEAQP
jgi:hypothetical protein